MFGNLEDIVARLWEQPLVIRKIATTSAPMTERAFML
jgi:hypothetical protein